LPSELQRTFQIAIFLKLSAVGKRNKSLKRFPVVN